MVGMAWFSGFGSTPEKPKSARKHGKVMLGWIFSGHFGWRGGFN
jgi:hypothetical protein